MEYQLLAKNKPVLRWNLIIQVKWHPLTTTTIKLNTDGSARDNPGPGGIGGVFYWTNREWVIGFYQHVPHTMLTMAELFANRCGLRLAKENSFRSLCVEVDSMVAIKIITDNHLLYHDIMSECRMLLSELETAPLMQIIGNKILWLVVWQRRHKYTFCHATNHHFKSTTLCI